MGGGQTVCRAPCCCVFRHQCLTAPAAHHGEGRPHGIAAWKAVACVAGVAGGDRREAARTSYIVRVEGAGEAHPLPLHYRSAVIGHPDHIPRLIIHHHPHHTAQGSRSAAKGLLGLPLAISKALVLTAGDYAALTQGGGGVSISVPTGGTHLCFTSFLM